MDAIRQRTMREDINTHLGLLEFMVFDDHEMISFKNVILQQFSQRYVSYFVPSTLLYFSNKIFVLLDDGSIQYFEQSFLQFRNVFQSETFAHSIAATEQFFLYLDKYTNKLYMYNQNLSQVSHVFEKKVSKLVSFAGVALLETFEQHVFQVISPESFVPTQFSQIEQQRFGAIFGKSRVSGKWEALDFRNSQIYTIDKMLVNETQINDKLCNYLKSGRAGPLLQKEQLFVKKYRKYATIQDIENNQIAEFMFDLRNLNTVCAKLLFDNLILGDQLEIGDEVLFQILDVEVWGPF